jgi:nitrogen fixation protein FixH
MNNTANLRNPWPWAIVGYFAIFISAMTVWIVFAVRQRVDLVRPDYYAHEMDFQKQIETVRRTKALPTHAALSYRAEDRSITVRLPNGSFAASTQGTLHLYRPSDAALDLELPLRPDGDGSQILRSGPLRPGFWKLQIEWATGGVEYYHEQPLVVSAR